ncbi:alkaline phosphatase [bacterium]|nr:alkaline phosphatase [bacterium]
MITGKALKVLILLAAGLVVVAAGVFLVFYNFNFSVVFYDPGQAITIHRPSNSREPLPLVPDTDVKNVIFFVGDGMGISQLAAARIHFAGPDGRLNIERMPVTGLLTTHAVGNLITDSAASATAMASGIKTRNSMVSVDSSGHSIPTILEVARDAGLATGIVTSTQLTDATPAAFAAHVPKRKMQSEIALQLLQSKVNVLLGEGAHFYPSHDSRSKRKDEADPIAVAKANGYRVVETRGDLLEADANHLLGVFEGILTDRMKPGIHPNPNSPSLRELTRKALEILSRNENGFFLLVEEEGTDKGGHANREDYFLHYLKSLDDAVQEALDFAQRDGQTLVIVTADHETGGMNIVQGSHKNRRPEFRRCYLEFTWDTDGHTAQPVPLFAFGPHAIRFTGLKDNTEVPKILADLLELKNFPR